MNIYKINHFASSITVFIPLIFHRVPASTIVSFYCGARLQRHSVPLRPPARHLHAPSLLFIQEADNIYLVQLILFPLPIYKVAHRGLAGLGSVSGNSYIAMSSEMYSGTRSSACRTRYAFPDASQRAVRPLRCV